MTQADEPQRIQLRRSAGWRLPENTVTVARPTKWGNPFRVPHEAQSRADAVARYRGWLSGATARNYAPAERERILRMLPVLRGRNLACWCPPDEPCHASVLLELANA